MPPRCFALLVVSCWLTSAGVAPARAQDTTSHNAIEGHAEARMMTEIRGGTEADRTAIQELHERDMRASRMQDFATLRSLMSTDAVVLAPGALPVRGQAELDASFERQRSSGSSVEVLRYEFAWNEVQIEGDYAFEWGQILGQFRPAGAPADSQPAVARYNVMRILRREEDGWKVHRTMWNEAPTLSDG